MFVAATGRDGTGAATAAKALSPTDWGRRVHAQATAPPPRLRALRLLHAKEKFLRLDAVDLLVEHMSLVRQ